MQLGIGTRKNKKVAYATHTSNVNELKTNMAQQL